MFYMALKEAFLKITNSNFEEFSESLLAFVVSVFQHIFLELTLVPSSFFEWREAHMH